eukprot:scaffold109781_cov92-Cyclotella_meneghiniana.AAC.5
MPMRKRAISARSTAIESNSRIDDDANKAGRNSSSGNLFVSFGQFVLLTILLSLLCLLLLIVLGIEPIPRHLGRFYTTPEKSSAVVLKRNLSQCMAHEYKAHKPKPELADKVEPLWLPAYPTSLPGRNGAIYSSFLSTLTGIESASRNYYRSSKKLKRCHYLDNANDIGVTCEIVHPIVPCDRPSPSAQSANFGKVVIIAIRNPITAFPAYHQEKAEKYHGAKGQVDNSDWISFRDQYVGNATHSPLLEEWKRFILEWRGMDPYSVAMYLPYERWLDETAGPTQVNKLAEVLAKEGMPVLYDSNSKDDSDNPTDLDCMWLQKVKEVMNAEDAKRTEEGWYITEYSLEQKQLLAKELDKFATEISQDNSRHGDTELVDILHEYRDSITTLI